MFPPLCFVDETKGDVDSSNLKEVLVDDNDEENNNIKIYQENGVYMYEDDV